MKYFLVLLSLLHFSGAFRAHQNLLGRSRRSEHCASDSEDEGDFITRLFKRFLPTPDDMGLDRINVDNSPEQYYCTKTRWASPVPGDDEAVRLFRPALAQTNFEKKALRLAYDANRDGWSASAFHSKVDEKGPAVVFARSQSGGVFGGYNPKGWVNIGEYRNSLAAFLFTWPTGDTKVAPSCDGPN